MTAIAGSAALLAGTGIAAPPVFSAHQQIRECEGIIASAKRLAASTTS